MPISEIESADKMMTASGLTIRTSGGISEEIIERCENRLTVKLPPSYKLFLGKYGRLAFGSIEIYGFTRDGFEATKAPSFLWVTETARSRGDLTQSMVAIMSSGFGPYFALDTEKINSAGEASVVLAVETPPADYTNLGDFGTFFLSEISEAVNRARRSE